MPWSIKKLWKLFYFIDKALILGILKLSFKVPNADNIFKLRSQKWLLNDPYPFIEQLNRKKFKAIEIHFSALLTSLIIPKLFIRKSSFQTSKKCTTNILLQSHPHTTTMHEKTLFCTHSNGFILLSQQV